MRALRLPLLVLATTLVAAACGGAAATLAPSAQAPTDPPSPSATPGASPSGAPSGSAPALAPITDPAVLVKRAFVSTGATGYDIVPGSQIRLTFEDGNQL